MNLEKVNIGNASNDGTGDSLRSGGYKINNNFNKVNTAVTALEEANFISPGKTDVASAITNPQDTDLIPIVSDLSNVSLFKLTYGNLKSALKIFLDTIYTPTTLTLSKLGRLISSSNKIPFFDNDNNAGLLEFDSDSTLAANSTTRIPSQSAIKGYVDAKLKGLSWKNNVLARTVSPLPTCSYLNGSNGVGATLTASTNGPLPAINGIAIELDKDILVNSETNKIKNGIYKLVGLGDANNPWVLIRRDDADTGSKLVNATVSVSEGIDKPDTQWTCPVNAPINIGTTEITFVLSGGGAGITELQGDVVGVGPGAANAQLSATGVSAGTYGSDQMIPIIQVDSKGRVVNATVIPLPKPARQTTVHSTGSLTKDQIESNFFNLSKGYRLIRMTVSEPARVRFYCSALHRDDDITRDVETDPAGDHGLIVELVLIEDLTLNLYPVPEGYNADVVPNSKVYYNITRLADPTGPITITVIWQEIE